MSDPADNARTALASARGLSRNGHLASPDPPDPARNTQPPVGFFAVGFWLGCGIALLLLARIVPALWARSQTPLVETALSFVAVGLATLGTLFLPTWARNWRTAVINLLAAGVFVAFAGALEGARTSLVIETSLRLGVALGAIATIWVACARRPLGRRILWLIAIFWSLGLPAAAAVSRDGASNQVWASTIFHCSPAGVIAAQRANSQIE